MTRVKGSCRLSSSSACSASSKSYFSTSNLYTAQLLKFAQSLKVAHQPYSALHAPSYQPGRRCKICFSIACCCCSCLPVPRYRAYQVAAPHDQCLHVEAS